MSFNQWLVFSQRPKENTPKNPKKMAAFPSWRAGFRWFSMGLKAEMQALQEALQKANER